MGARRAVGLGGLCGGLCLWNGIGNIFGYIFGCEYAGGFCRCWVEVLRVQLEGCAADLSENIRSIFHTTGF